MIHADSVAKAFNDPRELDKIRFDLENAGIPGVACHTDAVRMTLLKIMAGIGR